MIEQILYMKRGEYQRVFDSPENNPFHQYISHTPPKWQGYGQAGPRCVTVCRATQETLDSVEAEQLGNYTIGLVDGAQEIIDECYSSEPVPIPDTDPQEYYNPPVQIGAYA
jgi:hypothetical protein